MTGHTTIASIAFGLGGALLGLALTSPVSAGPLLPPIQVGNVLKMTNANVRIDL